MKAAASKELIEVDDLRVGMFIHLDMGWMSHPFPLGNFKIVNSDQVATIKSLGVQRVRWSPNQSDISIPAERVDWTRPAALDAGGDSVTKIPDVPVAEAAQPHAPTDHGAELAIESAPAPLSAAEAANDPEAVGTTDEAIATSHGANTGAGTLTGPDANTSGASVVTQPPTIAGALGRAGSDSTWGSHSTLSPADRLTVSGLGALSVTLDGSEAALRMEHKRKLAHERAALQVCERQFAEAAQDCKHVTDLVASKPLEARARAEQLSKALVDKMLGERELCIRLLSDAAGDKASMHALNVTIISLLMGRTFGLSDSDMLDLGVGAMLHDIGKLELPDRVRHREDHFSGSEQRFYEEHVAHGVVQARKMGLSPGATMVIAQHHEHADGSGFPLRLNTDRMTAAARIVSLVNRYDNLCNPNVASRALTPHESLSLLFAQGKTKFDTAILGAFIRMMGVYPAGSTVQLTDDRYALVVGVNSSRPLKPRVLVHEPKVARDDALIVDLEATAGLGIRRSIKPAQLPAKSLEYLAPRVRVAYFFEPHDSVPDAALAA